MKIVSVMTSAEFGGAEFAAVEMLDALVDRGHEAVMLSDQPQIARETRVTVKPIDTGPKLSRRSWPYLMALWIPYWRRLRKALEAEQPYDVLLLHYKKEQLMARSLPRHLRLTLVWAEWGPVPKPLRKGLPRLLYLAAAKRAQKIMAISDGTRESLAAVGVSRQKVVVVPNVMRADEIRFTPDGRRRVRESLGIPQDAFVVGCISRFHPKKRNDVVVNATRMLNGQVHLVLAGSGETEPELRALAEPLAERAHIIPTPTTDVADVASAFDVSVFCPSPAEGAPRSVLIGMLTERPCLATGAEAVADIITDGVGEITSPENDPSALATSIQRYLDDPEHCRHAGIEARRRAESVYDAPVVAERIEQLLRAAGAP